MNKLLSIIIPSYNMEGYIAQCLESLIITDSEHLQKLDIIVVNDGSKDETSRIAHKIGARYSFGNAPEAEKFICSNGTPATITDYAVIRVIDKENHHYGSCINAALPKAKGTFVKVLDADDSFDTKSLLSFIQMLSKIEKSDIDLIISDFEIVDENGNVTERRSYDLPVSDFFDLDAVSHLPNDFTMHAVTYRTERIQTTGYKQTEGCIYTDSEWMFAPMLAVRKCLYSPQILYRYLVGRNGQSVSAVTAVKNSEIQLRIMNNLMNKYLEVKAICSDAQKQYLQMELSRIYFCTIGGYFHNADLSLLKKEFEPADNKILNICPQARAEGGRKYVLFSTTSHPFHYVTAWQKSRYFRWRYPLFVRWYNCVRAFLKR